MIKIQNNLTGEVKNLYNVEWRGGEIISNRRLGSRYFNNNAAYCTLIEDNGEEQRIALNEGWEVIGGDGFRSAGKHRAKKREQKAATEDATEDAATDATEPATTPEPAPDATEPATTPEPVPATQSTEPAPEPAPEQPTTAPADNLAATIAAAVQGLIKPQAPAIDEATIRAIVAEEVAKIPTTTATTYKVEEVKTAPTTTDDDPLLKRLSTMIVNDQIIGRSPWLYGPAGSGKTTLAEKAALALGFKREQIVILQSVQQKYDLEGFVSATGELVETPFYKIFKDGGVLIADEMSTWRPNALVAFNNAIANRVYAFPVVGAVEASPDFHVVACDNTTGRGADSTYTARYTLCGSSLDRFNQIKLDYLPEQESRMADNDEDFVRMQHYVRQACEMGGLTYLCSPRAAKSFKGLVKCGFAEDYAFFTAVFGGWNEQDVLNVIEEVQRIMTESDRENKYQKMFTRKAWQKFIKK